MYIEVSATVSEYSTTPIPAGVGEIITNKVPMLKQAMMVPIEMGTLKAKKTSVRIRIWEVLFVMANSSGRRILLG